ncbi:MAG: hypothetical protein M3N29_08645 [Chloroflexota bacterium]|nr:hypothetical protein [Chloroflexota bacterium]
MSMPAGSSEGGPLSRRDLARGALAGVGMALGVGLAWAFLLVVVGLHTGLIAVAALGGWAVGVAVRRTAVATVDAARPVKPGVVRGLAAFCAVLAWAIGVSLSYLLSQLLLPEAATPLAERLSLGGLMAYAIETFDPVQAVSIVILAVVAWRSAR